MGNIATIVRGDFQLCSSWVNNGYGLVTGFSSSTPEPSSLLLGSGVVASMGIVRRKLMR